MLTYGKIYIYYVNGKVIQKITRF